jgi:uncharacterized repeat protein (TIGR04042 family)
MPEMRFQVRWPDDSLELCYSRSLVIKDHFVPSMTYSLDAFHQRSRVALTIAAERVREKFGFLCSRSLGQLARIEATATRFENMQGRPSPSSHLKNNGS